jgi:ribosomal protein L35AE/L33A
MFKVGDKVKWTDPNTKRVIHGTIKSINGNVAMVETDDGIVVPVHLDDLQHA